MLLCKHADQLVPMITHELLVRPLPEVHDKVAGVKAERFCDAEQVSILVDKPHLLLACARLDYTRGCQDYILAFGEEDHVLLL